VAAVDKLRQARDLLLAVQKTKKTYRQSEQARKQ
jgi:hypothetical protein